MIAWNVDHFGTLTCFAQNLLYYIVVRLWPVDALLQAPTIDDVTDKIEGVGLGML